MDITKKSENRVKYVSIALLWEGYDALQKKVEEFYNDSTEVSLSDYCLVPAQSRHCTLFKIAELKHTRNANADWTEVMRAVLKELNKTAIEKILQVHLAALRLRGSELRKYDATCSVQFEVERANIPLMRDKLTQCLARQRLAIDADLCIEFPGQDSKKNQGGLVFGSFARRSPTGSTEVWTKQLEDALPAFEPLNVQITVSNNDLTNERELDRDYLVVPLR